MARCSRTRDETRLLEGGVEVAPLLVLDRSRHWDACHRPAGTGGCCMQNAAADRLAFHGGWHVCVAYLSRIGSLEPGRRRAESPPPLLWCTSHRLPPSTWSIYRVYYSFHFILLPPTLNI
uniref:Uncharacterized protein n=1 Tax=Oryza sativa subsp. japonica TaxID=39947 RepID=Q6ZDX9_ORYSJ|nr:hypothetical protein [Oryza sativa Japonica Group]BAC83524.1 hypothetical protein [Oryza sativa Japonica Group]